MKRVVPKVLIIILSIFSATHSAHAGTVGPVGGTYVPVYDETTNTNFNEYIDKFDDYRDAFDDYVTLFDESVNTNTDSLKNIITGANPGGESAKACAQADNLVPVFAYTQGAWASSSAELGAKNLPLEIGASGGIIKRNSSASVRCLLQEIVEWQKLGLSIQIHSLLKTYISDAQTKQLNNQLGNQVAAANLNWAKAGNEVVNNGIASSEPVYNTNRSSSEYNVKGRQLDHILDQASADPTSGNPVGSLGICQPWRLDTAADLARNSRADVQDPSTGLDSEGTSCNLGNIIDPNDYSKFSENLNDPASPNGGISTFISILSNPGNSPLGAATAADSAARGRIERQQKSLERDAVETGFKPTKVCSGIAGDPYCLDTDSTATTPAGQNFSNITRQASQGDDQIRDGNTLDSTTGSSTETQSSVLNTGDGGLLGYDETPLALSTTVVNKLVQEFYDVINIGYFGIDNNPSIANGLAPTRDWAQGTMLMIYDEMKFDANNPQVVVTQNKIDPYDTQY